MWVQRLFTCVFSVNMPVDLCLYTFVYSLSLFILFYIFHFQQYFCLHLLLCILSLLVSHYLLLSSSSSPLSLSFFRGGVKSTNVPMNWRMFAQKGLNLMTFSWSSKLQLMKLVNMFPVLVAKIPLVVMELVIKLLWFLYHTLFNTKRMFIIYVSATTVFLQTWKRQK